MHNYLASLKKIIYQIVEEALKKREARHWSPEGQAKFWKKLNKKMDKFYKDDGGTFRKYED